MFDTLRNLQSELNVAVEQRQLISHIQYLLVEPKYSDLTTIGKQFITLIKADPRYVPCQRDNHIDIFHRLTGVDKRILEVYF